MLSIYTVACCQSNSFSLPKVDSKLSLNKRTDFLIGSLFMSIRSYHSSTEKAISNLYKAVVVVIIKFVKTTSLKEDKGMWTKVSFISLANEI